MERDDQLLTPERFLLERGERAPSSELARLVRVLRGPKGCPWDRKQGALEMLDHLIDEAYELKAALLGGALEDAEEELGDLLFTSEFVRQAMPTGVDPERAAHRLVDKMVHRHPHVFEEQPSDSGAHIPRLWERQKARERPGASRRLDHGIPAGLPLLRRVDKLLTRAAAQGFAYGSEQQAWAKIEEELLELQEAVEADDSRATEAEFGDVLLALLSWAHVEGLSTDGALLQVCDRFVARLEAMERVAGAELESVPTSELPELYRRAKGQGGTAPPVFLNYCGVSPWPDSVKTAVHRAARQLGAHGLSASLALREEREQTRADILRLVGGGAHQVVYLPNVSTAALSVAYSLDWQPGQSLVLGRSEFPANTVPWRLAAEQFDLRVLWFDEDLLRREPERGWAQLGEFLQAERPRILALSAVSFWSGFRLEAWRLGELGRATDTLIYVDGIQAIGAVPWTIEEGIDGLAGGSHKALQAPEGAGFLVNSPRLAERWVPRIGSWLSLPEPVDFLLDGKPDTVPNDRSLRARDPSVVEGGSLNSLGYAGLSASIRERLAIPPEQVLAHYLPLQDQLEAGLEELGWSSLRAPAVENRSSILSFDPPTGVGVPGVAAFLMARGVSCGTPNGRLRFGFHWQSQKGDVVRTLELMEQYHREKA